MEGDIGATRLSLDRIWRQKKMPHAQAHVNVLVFDFTYTHTCDSTINGNGGEEDDCRIENWKSFRISHHHHNNNNYNDNDNKNRKFIFLLHKYQCHFSTISTIQPNSIY